MFLRRFYNVSLQRKSDISTFQKRRRNIAGGIEERSYVSSETYFKYFLLSRRLTTYPNSLALHNAELHR